MQYKKTINFLNNQLLKYPAKICQMLVISALTLLVGHQEKHPA